MGELVRMPKKGVTLGKAVDAFICQPDLAPTTVRSYRQTLAGVVDAFGPELPIGELESARLETLLEQRWGKAAPATWNRQLATLRSFLSFCRRRSWVADARLDAKRRREHEDRTRSIPALELERLWRRQDLALRDKALWRLLYETAARATEVLSLNVEDVDVANKRARIRSKGGAIEFVHFQTGSARLLPRLMAGRSAGPLFLADRRPAPARAPASVDVDPETGRARLSYRRAEEIFHAATGWTLHQLRHSAITHLAEDNVALPLLMAKSRHASLRSLQRYARPGTEAVAALTAAHDPARRRR
jgi:integrase/recombinase XerC/integrase/recombinase XerD